MVVALGSLVLAWFFNDLPCSIMSGINPKAVCEPPMLWMFWVPLVLSLLAVAVGGWRFYRDHYCGEMYDDYDPC